MVQDARALALSLPRSQAKRVWRMRWFLLALMLALAALAATARAAEPEVIARAGEGRLERHAGGQLVLHVKGTPFEMGYQHGTLLRDMVRKNTQAILDNQGELGRKTEYLAYRGIRPIMHMRLRPHVPARFKDEMRGLAAGSGLSYDDIEASNLFPEAFHCSGMALMGKATHDGSLYHVRILDYMTMAGLQDMAIVIVHEPNDHRKWVNVSFAGFVGTVTGMNEDQVTIGEMGGRGLFYWNGMPMAFLMRDALERAGTMDEALAIFRRTKRTCEYYYVISDGKIPDARGVWATPDDFEVMAPGSTFGFLEVGRPRTGAAGGKAFLEAKHVEVSKHRILLKDKAQEVEGFIAMQPEDCLVLSGSDRYQHFLDRMLPRYGKVDAEGLIDMIKRPVAMRSNLHCAIFHPATLEMWVAVAASDGSPACDQPYFRYRLSRKGEVSQESDADADADARE